MAKKNKTKGFFALDVHQFERIQQKGMGVEEAATYLSLLKSTDQSNVTSSGGVRSVMDYSGLSRAEVKRAIKNLEVAGLIESLEVERTRARKAEHYNLPVYDTRQPLSSKERGIVNTIEAGKQPLGSSDVQAAHRASSKGWIEKLSIGWQVIEHINSVAFIPNSFVQVSDGHSPLYRLMNTGELGAIMLTAELYRLQNLMDDRGVPLDAIRGFFENAELIDMRFDHHRLRHLRSGRDYKDQETGKVENCETSFSPHKFRGGL